ncbi:hypothetical protein EYZ11_001657 [Aspergillus tanneri]|uniref:Uncharacterized protein n=1 Tax=Aspergillus tanneri TaxID=1220188 RepID=A0A4S3JSQ5_9EURO|nr:hypothetical protein EYZ11_001657 [Aspergillus tanneri]
MSLVRGRRESLALKDVPQMTPTVAAHDLSPLRPKGLIAEHYNRRSYRRPGKDNGSHIRQFRDVRYLFHEECETVL